MTVLYVPYSLDSGAHLALPEHIIDPWKGLGGVLENERYSRGSGNTCDDLARDGAVVDERELAEEVA